MSADADDPDTTAMVFRITTGYSCDLNQSLSANTRAFVYSDAITDEMLLEAYESQTGSSEGLDAAALRAALALTASSAAGPYEGQYGVLQVSCRQWDEAHAAYLEGLSAYNEKQAEYEQGLAAYEQGMQQYRDGEAQYLRGLARLEESRARYEQGLLDAEAGQRELEDIRIQLEEGEAAYAEVLPKLADGEAKLGDARRQLADLDPCRWILLDLNGNSGFVQVKSAAENLVSLESTFALLFVLVGALVIFATVSKMVDEQRSLVGTTKAVGFFNSEIFAKYLCFGVAATVFGTLLGILAARFGLESFVLKSYSLYYIYPLSKAAVTPLPTVLALFAGVILAFTAIWLACTELLRSPAIRLMQPKVPVGAKRSRAGGRRSRSLYSRLILLNMRSDIRRVLVTVVSVAGCCALVVIGITLKTAMTGAVEKQFQQITDYDWRVSFSPEESDTAQREIEALLRDAGAEYAPLRVESVSYRFDDMQAAELFCCDPGAVDELYRLRDWKSGQPLSPTDDGILIQKRVAESYGLAPGSVFELSLGGSRSADVTVAGIFDHYIGRPMFMSPAYYEQVFGRDCVPNAFLVRLNGAEPAALEEALRSVRGFASVSSTSADRAAFDASTGVVNSLVALFIFMAAVMAGVVLLNLTSIYVMQKKRELIIMRINGFTVREVVGYMLWETVLTTFLGILLGSALGSWIAYRIVRTLEQPFIQFQRDISIPAWILGAAVTLFFTALVNLIALRPVKNLKLTDVS